MANINVSIDAKGNLVCDDITGFLSESITWVPDTNTILSIQSITATTGSFNPAPSARNNWTGTLSTDGTMPDGKTGIGYNIIVNPKNVSSGQKQRSPKITVAPPEDKALKAETLHATKS